MEWLMWCQWILTPLLDTFLSGCTHVLMCECWFSNTLLHAFRALLWMAVQWGSVSINLALWLLTKLIQKTMPIQCVSITISKAKAITISSGICKKQGLPFISVWQSYQRHVSLHWHQFDTPIRGMCPFFRGDPSHRIFKWHRHKTRTSILVLLKIWVGSTD